MFSSEPLASDKRNHCVPIYEVLKVPDANDEVILVMPALRPWYLPFFATVGEGIDFFSQIFEVSNIHPSQSVLIPYISMFTGLTIHAQEPCRTQVSAQDL